MSDIFDSFNKRKEYLVCIDSDGCAMDTMDIKHLRCFGPCMIREWELEPWEGDIQKQWNDINLYTMTRGINRFLGLYQALESVDRSYKKIENLNELGQWVNSAKELSNNSLLEAIKQSDSPILKKALNWSEAVNRWIVELPEEHKLPFEGVCSCLKEIHRVADVAVVSSANQQAIMEEWEKHGLLQFTDVILSQNAGSKAFCIQTLLKQGYEKTKVLMVGDAPGDRDAAKHNGVLFFPILVRKETKSWNQLATEGMGKFLDGTFDGAYHTALTEAFEKNLSGD